MIRLALPVLVFYACDDHTFESHHVAEEVEGTGSSAVASLMSNNCVACHATGGSPPALDGDLCDSLVGVPSAYGADAGLVVEGDSDGSYLIHKLEDDSSISGNPMPPTSLLPDDKIEAVREWILAGALRD